MKRARALGLRLSLLLALVTMLSGQAAPPGGAVLQVFIRADGTVPDWRELTLTITRLQIGGVDAATGQRYLLTAFEGSRTLVIPRTAAGQARFLVDGPAQAGRLDQVLLTLGPSSLTTEPGSGGTSPRVVPLSVKDNPLQLRPSRPVTLAAGETRSLAASILMGSNAVLTKQGVLALKPTLSAETIPTATAENFLNGMEVLGASLTLPLPQLGFQVQRTKVFDPQAGTVRDVNVRTDTGASVDYGTLRAENESRWRAVHGAMNAPLVEKLQALGSADYIFADIQLLVPGPQTLQHNETTAAGFTAAHHTFVEERKAAAASVVADAISALHGVGASVVGTELHPPVVHVLATRAMLEEVAAFLPSAVEVAATPQGGTVLGTNGAVDLVEGPLHELQAAIGPSSGVRIALVEFGACVNTDHEAFAGVTFEEPAIPCGADGIAGNGGHSTTVAGALVSTSPGPFFPNETRPPAGPIGAQGATLFTANTCTIPEQVRSRDPHVVNLSCLTDSSPQYEANYEMDSAVFTDRIFVAKGSGNPGEGPLMGELRNTAFCHSYNAMCVAAYGFSATVGPTAFGDDSVPGGGWQNWGPLFRERPDIVGPGGVRLPRYDAPTQSEYFINKSWAPANGTSFTTPQISAMAALLMGTYPQHLTGDPTLVRAVLLTSAAHGFPGRPRVPSYSDDIDDYSGAGAPRGDRAIEILDNHRFSSRFLHYPDDFDANGDLATPITFPATTGDRVRIVMTYDHCPVSVSDAADPLRVDLDLVAFERDSDVYVTRFANNSLVDNTEYLEWTAGLYVPVATGPPNITVRPHVARWDPCPDGSTGTYVAIAWDLIYVGDLPPAGG